MSLFITDGESEQLLSIETAIPVVEEAFRLAGEGLAENPPRTRMPVAFKAPRYEGYLQIGAAAISAEKVAGFKLFSNFGKPVSGRQYGRTWNFLFSLETGELLAIIQAHAVGIIRTSAVSGVAVKHLSRQDASVVGLYGVGTYAEGQLAAVCAARAIPGISPSPRCSQGRTDPNRSIAATGKQPSTLDRVGHRVANTG